MYINYGDKNFFEYGMLVDSEHSDTEIKILYCMPIEDDWHDENSYLFADCTVDIEDDWIDRKLIMDYIGMAEENFDNVQFAIGCVEYYGVENFSEPYGRFPSFYDGYIYSREEIEKQLKYYFIASDNLDITW